MSAPQRYSQERVMEALRKSRGLKAVAAESLGCDRHTVDKYCQRYPAVAAVVEEQRETVTDIAEGKLFTKINEGEAWAVCFYLKTQGKNRGYVERTETDVTSGGQPLSFTLQIAQQPDDADSNSD